MNVFVLSTGRTGTMSLERACGHLSNYTVAHESRCNKLGADRLNFPDNHIEIDNRLSWFLGRLDATYGDNAIYIHMIRNSEEVAKSYGKRWNRETSIIRAYAYGILKRQEQHIGNTHDICLDYVETVNENIVQFLKDKSKSMTFRLDNAEEDLKTFWELIDGKGDYSAAQQAFADAANTSAQSTKIQEAPFGKVVRIIKKFPAFLRNA